jgi:hypothetical protein
VITTEASEETWPVATAKPADVWPAGTVTLPGTLATDALLLVSFTGAPPAGAAELSITLPAAGVPAVTVLGLRFTVATPFAELLPEGFA